MGDLTRHFGGNLMVLLAGKLGGQWEGFPAEEFLGGASDLGELGLMDRVRAIAARLDSVFPEDGGEALDIQRRIMGPPLAEDQQVFNDGYWMLPLAEFWSAHRLADRKRCITALEEWTQRGTAEFAVRRLIETDPDEAVATVEEWAGHPSFHVRRLASEGTRPYLPWGGKLKVDRSFGMRYLEIISRLKDDPAAYVRRSVGNHVRDWRRIDPDVADRWIRTWNPPKDVLKLALPKNRSGARK